MPLSDLQVFQEQTYTAVTELQAQYIKVFNAASRGAIVLSDASSQGDYSETALWAKISGLVRRRDAYGSGAVAPATIAQLLAVSVKVAAGTPPVSIDPGMLRWIMRSPNEAAAVIGKQLAEDSLADMLNTALSAFVSAVGAQATNVYDGTAGAASLESLVNGAGKLGDRSQSVACWVLHSKSITDIYGAAITNGNNLFRIETVSIVEDGFGRPFIITDSPALLTAGTPNVYHLAGIVSGGIVIERNDDWIDNIDTDNGDENILRTYQAEWSYNLGLRGFAWDKAAGGASPADAALGTATNWDMIATSHKDLAGVLVNCD